MSGEPVNIVPIFGADGSELALVERASGFPPRRAPISADRLTPSLYIEEAEDDLDTGIFAPAYKRGPHDLSLEGIDAINALAHANPTVVACVQIISQAMARRGWRLTPAKGPDGKPIPKPNEADGAFLHDWYQHCHPYMSIEQIIGTVLPGLVQTGRYFLAIAYNSLANERTEYGQQPGRIDPLIPQGAIRARLDRFGDFRKPAWAQVRGKEEKPILYDWEEILWLQLPNVVHRGIFPLSPVDQAQLSIRINNQAKAFTYSFFTSGGKMGIVVRIPPGTPNAAIVAEETRRKLERSFTDPKRAFRIITLVDGMALEDSPDTGEKKTLTMKDIQEFNRDEICAIFGVDPRLIAADRGGNLGGKGEREQAWNELITNAVVPRVNYFNAAWTKQLHRQGFGITDWDFELLPEKISASEESREAVTRIYRGAGEIGAVDVDSVDDLNAIRAEINPELPPLTAVPRRLTATSPTVPTAPAEQRSRAPWVSRFDVRAATKLLDGIEDDLAGELGAGLRKVAASLTATLSAAYASGDIKAVKKLDNWAPGGGELIKIGARLWKRFFQDSQAMARAEIKAAAKRALKEDAIADGGPGDIADFIDLANMDFFDDLFGGMKKSALKTFREGLSAGWSRKEFLSKLGDRFSSLEEKDLSIAVRTQATDFFNLARQQMFNASDGLVESVEFAAILDDRTTEACTRLDGVVFRGMDDPNLDTARPPLHYNCRSVIIPVMAGDEWKPTPQRDVQTGLRLIQSGFGKRACSHGR